VSVDSHHRVDHDCVGETPPLTESAMYLSHDRAAGSGWSTGCETTCNSACAAGLLREGMRLFQWKACASSDLDSINNVMPPCASCLQLTFGSWGRLSHEDLDS